VSWITHEKSHDHLRRDPQSASANLAFVCAEVLEFTWCLSEFIARLITGLDDPRFRCEIKLCLHACFAERPRLNGPLLQIRTPASLRRTNRLNWRERMAARQSNNREDLK
jgi:hypothetical protein